MELLVIRVGSESRPASPSDIVDMKNKFIEAVSNPDENGNNVLVTHHAVCFEYITVSSKVMFKKNTKKAKK